MVVVGDENDILHPILQTTTMGLVVVTTDGLHRFAGYVCMYSMNP